MTDTEPIEFRSPLDIVAAPDPEPTEPDDEEGEQR